MTEKSDEIMSTNERQAMNDRALVARTKRLELRIVLEEKIDRLINEIIHNLKTKSNPEMVVAITELLKVRLG